MNKYLIVILALLILDMGSTAQVNLAPSAVASASASSSGSYGPANWNDGLVGPSYNFGWVGTDPSSFPTPAWLQYQWSTAQTLNRVRFYNPSHINGNFVYFYGNADLQYDSAGTWVYAATVSGQSGTYYDVSFPNVTTTKIRMTNFVITGAHNPGWDEIEVYLDPPPPVPDVGILSINSPGPVVLSSPVSLNATIVNNGPGQAGGFVVCVLAGTLPPACDTLTGITIPPGDTLNYTFSFTLGLNPGWFYGLCFYTVLPGDPVSTNDTLCEDVLFTPAGLGDPGQATSIKVFPQPANEGFVLEGEVSGMLIALYTTDGRLLVRSQVPDGADRSTFDTRMLDPGLYILELKGPQTTQRRKLLIAR